MKTQVTTCQQPQVANTLEFIRQQCSTLHIWKRKCIVSRQLEISSYASIVLLVYLCYSTGHKILFIYTFDLRLFLKFGTLARASAEKEWHTKGVFEGSVRRNYLQRYRQDYGNYPDMVKHPGVTKIWWQLLPTLLLLSTASRTSECQAAEAVSLSMDSASANLQLAT